MKTVGCKIEDELYYYVKSKNNVSEYLRELIVKDYVKSMENSGKPLVNPRIRYIEGCKSNDACESAVIKEKEVDK